MMVYVRMYNAPDGDSRKETARSPNADLGHSGFGALMEVVGAEVIIWVLNRQKLSHIWAGKCDRHYRVIAVINRRCARHEQGEHDHRFDSRVAIHLWDGVDMKGNMASWLRSKAFRVAIK
jgi:hypothetical protein